LYWQLSEISGDLINVDELATPKHFRLIDCSAYCNHNILSVVHCGFDEFPYATISHVWNGRHRAHLDESFNIHPITGYRINIQVLRSACRFAMMQGASHIWMDRLCVLQTSSEDVDWQIQHMADIYRRCIACYVIAGGLGFHNRLGETSEWIFRSWTLQEALLPPKVYWIFQWKYGDAELSWVDPDSGRPIVAKVIASETERAAVMPLEDMLSLCIQPQIKCSPYIGPDPHRGEEEAPPLTIGRYADIEKHHYRLEERPRQVSRTAVVALLNALRTKGDEREVSIWRCSLMRTSKYEVDTVLCIMGLFNITLQRNRIQSRKEGLIALTQAIMHNGGRANWLAASPKSPVMPTMCTMPLFPQPSTDRGQAQTLHPISNSLFCAHEKMNTKLFTWYLADAPKGIVDEVGTLKFTAPMADVIISDIKIDHQREGGFPEVAVIHSGEVQMDARLAGTPGTHAVVVGNMSQGNRVVLMLLQPQSSKGATQIWHKTGIAAVRWPDNNFVWPEKYLYVGGVHEE